MIQRNDLFSIPFYDKTCFSGSYRGMRFRLEKHTKEKESVLLVTYWPGPYAYTATPDDKKKTNTFEYSEAGISLACDWLNQIYEENEALFSVVMP